MAAYHDRTPWDRPFEPHPGAIAAIIVGPVAGNMGVVPPADGFLAGLGRITAERGALLILDEVITGFRVAPGGAQELFDLTPDITCLGKIIGGGLPVGAYGGRAEIMEMVAPLGPMYQAGTLSGNPLAVTAGLATLRELQQPGTYERLEALGQRLAWGLSQAFQQAESSHPPVSLSQTRQSLSCLFYRAVDVFIRMSQGNESGLELGGREVNSPFQHAVEVPSVLRCVRPLYASQRIHRAAGKEPGKHGADSVDGGGHLGLLECLG